MSAVKSMHLVFADRYYTVIIKSWEEAYAAYTPYREKDDFWSNQVFPDAVKSFNGDISKWDVSRVTDMSLMFHHEASFDGDLSKWDVSRVKTMSSMFYHASSFHGDLSRWDVSRVTNMDRMFFSAKSFTADILEWDVSRVTNMYQMFASASSFNGDISKWDVSKVQTMLGMFFSASSFNGDISNWDVSRVTSMYGMFTSASSFNGDISKWDVPRGMFVCGARSPSIAERDGIVDDSGRVCKTPSNGKAMETLNVSPDTTQYRNRYNDTFPTLRDLKCKEELHAVITLSITLTGTLII